MDYRKFYKQYYGINFGLEMAVHHCDFDRSNNDIDNLLLMPADLHHRYHFLINSLNRSEQGIINFSVKIDCNNPYGYQADILKKLGKTLTEIEKWKEYKFQCEMNKEAKEYQNRGGES